MQFLSNGDFGFPFTWLLFLVKQFFIWSYQTGALNADGIIRMPGRLLDLVVFMMFGNLGFEYFFIGSSLTIMYASFFYFVYKFLEIKNIRTLILGSLFYTLNPIFLANLSKIGLVLAAAMLPLCLVMIRELFEQKRFRYLFLWLLLLNISLIHPFTFAVNLAVSGAYLVYQAWHHRGFVMKNLSKFALIASLFVLLNTYFLLPLASMHTINKNTLSDTLTSTPTDYTSLVSVLNTGNIFTGLSLSKNVVNDYDFYNNTYQNYYFFGAFGFYALLIVLYIQVAKRLNANAKRLSIILFAAFTLLVALTTVKFLYIDMLIRVLINLPGGWAFRSPLKWQLYIPLTLFGLLALFMKNLTTKWRQVTVYGLLAITFVLMNSYLAVDVYKKLLVPRSIHYFSALQQLNIDHKNLLIVSGNQCWSYVQNNPVVMTEVNQILSSKNIQVKRVSVDDIDQINLSSYAYIFSCQDIMRPFITQAYHFTRTNTFANNAFQLYTNQTARPYVYATTSAFALSIHNSLGDKYNFVSGQLHENFDFVSTQGTVGLPVIGFQDIFDNLALQDIRAGSIAKYLPYINAGQQTLYLGKSDQALYYSAQNGQLSIAAIQKPGYQAIPAANKKSAFIAVPVSKLSSVSYDDPMHSFQNLIANPSFEQGPWQKKVNDCYNFDNNPQIGMSIDKQDKTDGQQSLQLESSNHIACTGPGLVSVKAGQQYLLSFDYWSPDNDAGYYINFSGTRNSTLSGRLTSKGNGWQNFTKVITAPSVTDTLRLQVEVFPGDLRESAGIARFDNFRLTAIPNVTGEFYVVSNPTAKLHIPAKVDFSVVNPTKTTIHVRGASLPFYLATSESYSEQWRLEPNSRNASSWVPTASVTALPNEDHLRFNGSMNGWYIDPANVCRTSPASCTYNTDGSYNMNLVMEFTPQRWFYAGALISGCTFIVGFVLFIYDVRRDRRRGVKYRL